MLGRPFVSNIEDLLVFFKRAHILGETVQMKALFHVAAIVLSEGHDNQCE